MADVQLEHGYTRIANRLLAALAAAPWDSASQSALVLSLIRMTYGARGRTEAVISTQEWASLTGLSIAQVKRARAALEKNGVLQCTQDEDQKRGVGKTWRLEKDFTRWKRFRVDTSTVAEAEAVVAQSLADEGGSPPDPGSPTTPGSPMTPPAENADNRNAPAGPQGASEHGDTAQGGSSVTPGSLMNPGSLMSPGTEMNPDPGTEMNPRTPPNVAQPRDDPEGQRKGKKRSTTIDRRESSRKGEPPEPPSVGRSVEVRLKPGEVVEMLAPEAVDVLADLKHHGSKKGTARALVAEFLYPDGGGELGSPVVKGLSFEERLSIVGRALIQFGGKADTWSSAHFAGFVRRVRDGPKPGTEAARAASRREAPRTPVPPVYHEPKREGLEKADFREILKRHNVDVPKDTETSEEEPAA